MPFAVSADDKSARLPAAISKKRSPSANLNTDKQNEFGTNPDRGRQERVEGGLSMFSMESAATHVQAYANTPNTMRRVGALRAIIYQMALVHLRIDS